MGLERTEREESLVPLVEVERGGRNEEGKCVVEGTGSLREWSRIDGFIDCTDHSHTCTRDQGEQKEALKKIQSSLLAYKIDRCGTSGQVC